MEAVLITNNGQMAWSKLSTFGLHSRRSFIGFQRYVGKNSAVMKIDPVSGMKIVFYPAQAPRSERASRTISFKTPCKVGRPAIFSHPKQAHTPGVRGRKAFIGPREELIFAGPQRKRGPKAESSTETLVKPAKRGRMSVADKLKVAKPGDIVTEKGGYWQILACGVATWHAVSA